MFLKFRFAINAYDKLPGLWGVRRRSKGYNIKINKYRHVLYWLILHYILRTTCYTGQQSNFYYDQ